MNPQAPIRPITRTQYAAWGLGLMLLKYVVEYFVVLNFGGQSYGPLAFLTPVSSVRAELVRGADSWVAWFILAWSIPFVFIAMWFSMRRAWDAGQSPWLCLWILCPILNLVFMLTMCFVPTANRGELEQVSTLPTEEDRDVFAWLGTIMTGVLIVTALPIVSIYFLGDYNATIFFSSPVLLGVICGYSLKQFNHDAGAGSAVMISLAAVFLACAVLVALAMEGVVCIAMALPIMLPAAGVGGLIGYLIACSTQIGPSWMTIALFLPSAAMIEYGLTRPVVYEVVSAVEVNARPEEVWGTVIAFPEINTPPGLLFKLGVAWPVRARIEGEGEGAIRYCEFSTGDFVEPITAWQPPNRLAFSVEDQPCPLTELSPYQDIHPPHLDGFMRSYRGEFRLIEIPGGKTRLEGRTWYSVDMYPQLYWKLWTDSIVHAIHDRVLQHIRVVVESKTASIESLP